MPVGTVEDTGPLGIRMHMPIPNGMPTLARRSPPSLACCSCRHSDFYLRAFDTATGKEI